MTIKCQECSQTFSRSEHLTRHLTTHTKEKPHICQICQKRFTRSDVLSRHMNSHRLDGSHDAAQALGPNFRACLPCASKRVRCLGSFPCPRCSSKNIDCQYPAPRRNRSQLESRDISTTSTSRPPIQDGQIEDHVTMESSQKTFSAWDEQNTQMLDMDSQPPTFSQPVFEAVSFDGQVDSVQAIASQEVHISGYNISAETYEPNYDNYSAILSYEFPVPSNHQQADLGYTAINWLSPNDLSYNDFTVDAQYFDINIANEFSELQNLQPNSGHNLTETIAPHPFPPEPAPEPCTHETPTSLRSGSSIVSLSSPSKSSNYYADGANAREPRYGKLKRRESDLGSGNNVKRRIILAKNDHDFSFCAGIEKYLDSSEANTTDSIPPAQYLKIKDQFQKLCLAVTNPFKVDYFPPPTILNLAQSLYFEYFHPIFPLLHRPSTVNGSGWWLISLATAAIGIGYLGNQDASQCSEAFLEFLYRCLEHAEYSTNTPNNTNLDVQMSREHHEIVKTQARILCAAAMYHSRNESFVQKAFVIRCKLVTLCLRGKMLHETKSKNVSERQSSWKEWISRESEKRVGYCIWWLDCIMAYSDNRPQLRLEDAKESLPCHEDIWEACDESEWNQMIRTHAEPPSLFVALETLYKKKAVGRNVGEFGRILLIHGLYHRTWEVAKYQRDALSNWIPAVPGTREPSPSTDASSATDSWLPRNSVYSKWRNSACDCLDTLHWSANSLVAQKAGLEHPTILQLHFARLILLTPVNIIQSLTSTLEQVDKHKRFDMDKQYQSERGEILRWFIQDQYKARLAVVHAGTICWHVRRYSFNSMFEPFAVFVSSLILWAYSTSSQVVYQQEQQRQRRERSGPGMESAPSSTRPDDEYPLINLDRPCDDELIQTYVLHGTKMTAYLAGVGDLCKEGSSSKILREGARIIVNNGIQRSGSRDINEKDLVVVPTWGIGTKHAVFLERLADATEGRTI